MPNYLGTMWYMFIMTKKINSKLFTHSKHWEEISYDIWLFSRAMNHFKYPWDLYLPHWTKHMFMHIPLIEHVEFIDIAKCFLNISQLNDCEIVNNIIMALKFYHWMHIQINICAIPSVPCFHGFCKLTTYMNIWNDRNSITHFIVWSSV